MKITIDYQNRQVIPRFLPFEIAHLLGEVNPLEKFDKSNPDLDYSYIRKEIDWIIRQDNFASIDYLATSYIYGSEDRAQVKYAAKHIIKNKNYFSHQAVILANKILSEEKVAEIAMPTEKSQIYNYISTLKFRTIEMPMNSINWVNLSYCYACLGQFKKSERCMGIALIISPNNRYIIRSAVGLFLQSSIRDLDRVKYILNNTYLSKSDPWIISAVIAVSDSIKVKSQTIKKGIEILSSNKFSNFATSELASSVGTLNYRSGNSKKSRLFIRQSLINPNENSLAQASWISQYINLEAELAKKNDQMYNFEDNTRRFFSNKQSIEALDSSLSWLNFQPFSTMALSVYTYIASTCFSSYAHSEEKLNENKYLIKDNPTLINNLCFTQIMQNKLNEASETIKQFKLDELKTPIREVVSATLGLFSLKTGNIEMGRNLYISSIEYFNKQGDYTREALALYYWGLAEDKIDKRRSIELIEKSESLVRKYSIIELLNKL